MLRQAQDNLRFDVANISAYRRVSRSKQCPRLRVASIQFIHCLSLSIASASRLWDNYSHWRGAYPRKAKDPGCG